jgi:hypothetical protein
MTTYYVAICLGYWGRGKTETEALANMRKAGGRKQDKTVLYRIECEADKDPPVVDGCGTMYWHGERTQVAEIVRGKRKACEPNPA